MVPAFELEQPSQVGWEDPTTIQAPTWEDEPQQKPQVAVSPNVDSWLSSVQDSVAPVISHPPTITQLPEEEFVHHTIEQEQQQQQQVIREPEPQQAASSALPVQLQQLVQKVDSPSVPSVNLGSTVLPAKPATPVPHSRPGAGAHRNSGRYKISSDQAVIMPSSSFGSAIEKLGMQFGSVSLNGDVISDNNECVLYSFNVALHD